MYQKKARIKDIAGMAGVSTGTVDRVLHKRNGVAAGTVEKVMGIVKKLNYSPDFLAQSLKTRKTIRLVSLLPYSTGRNSFWEKHTLGLIKAVQELNPFPLTLTQVNFKMTDGNDFRKKAREVISLSPDGVIFAPVYKSESLLFCKSLTRAKIPFVFVDVFIEDSGFLSYVGEDIFQSGMVAGRLTDLVTPENNDILIINIGNDIRNVRHLASRTAGFLNYFRKSGRNTGKKIKLNIPDSGYKNIKDSIDNAFEKYPRIASVFITDSKSYKIASYLKNNNLNSINLIGYDLLDANIVYLKSGIIKFLINRRPEEQTYKAVKNLFEFISLNKVPEKIEYLPIDIVTTENVDYFINTPVKNELISN